jgi:peptidoglycan/LPS O-acetylase OafA/YrhL
MSTDSLIWRNPRLAGRIPELDGIRGLAILLVLLFHSFAGIQGSVPGTWQSYFVASLRLTWSGVDLFFVLSGFLIGGILYDAKSSRNYFRTFYLRRIYRIFPLYFIWIALFVAGVLFVGSDKSSVLQPIFNRSLPLWVYPLFVQNIGMFFRNNFGPLWMTATWSLAVEEQFYFVLPFLIRKLSYRGIIWMAAAAILCAPAVRFALWLSGSDLIGPYTLLPSRADSLGLGVIIALACRNQTAWEWLASHRRQLLAALLFFGCGCTFFVKYQRFTYVFGLTWIAAFYAVLLLLTVVHPGRILEGCFRSRLLMRLGTVAYAVYIFHVGINALVLAAVFRQIPSVRHWSSMPATLLSFLISISLAILSWRVLEKPLIRHAHAAYRY